MVKDKKIQSVFKKVNSLKDFYYLINIFQIHLRSRFSNKIIKNPFQLIRISPEKIRYVFPQESSNEHKYYNKLNYFILDPFKLINIGLVKGGKWDKNMHGKKFENSDVFKAFKKRFQKGISWEDTDFFHRVKRNIEEESETKWGCKTIKEFKGRLDSLDELYEQIENDGYKNQRELGNLKIYDEIRLCVSRDGKISFLNGQHRLSIAKLLELKQVPILVSVWHKKFVDEVRKEYPNKKLTPKFLSQFLKE